MSDAEKMPPAGRDAATGGRRFRDAAMGCSIVAIALIAIYLMIGSVFAAVTGYWAMIPFWPLPYALMLLFKLATSR